MNPGFFDRIDHAFDQAIAFIDTAMANFRHNMSMAGKNFLTNVTRIKSRWATVWKTHGAMTMIAFMVFMTTSIIMLVAAGLNIATGPWTRMIAFTMLFSGLIFIARATKAGF